MLLDNPHLLADRNVNPKLSGVQSCKWRKTKLGERTGKQLFTELEKRIHAYNNLHKGNVGEAVVDRFCKDSDENGDEHWPYVPLSWLEYVNTSSRLRS